VQKWDAPVARMSTAEKQLCRRDELWPRVRSSRCCSENQNEKIKVLQPVRECPCGQCTRKRLRRVHADVTSYGRGYDRRDVVSKTQIRKLKYYNCPRCPCGQCTRSDCDAHAVDYRRHERWWATPVVKSSKLVVSSMKLTKRVAGFVVFLYFVHGISAP
jgi:hypothetical protein